jgi:hypothetical protein
MMRAFAHVMRILDKLHRWEGSEAPIEMQRGLRGLVAVGDEAAEEVDQEV